MNDKVEKVIKNNQTLYRCRECGLHFSDEETALACAEWDAKYHACNLEIARKSVDVTNKDGS